MKRLISLLILANILSAGALWAQTPKSGMLVEEEEELQRQLLREKYQNEEEIPESRKVDRFPKAKPIFKKPPGPPQGGTIEVTHPRAAEGLMRINKDGSYQYRTQTKNRSKSSSFKVGMMTPPTISSGNPAITYESMYGDSEIFALQFDYEWQPFSSIRNIGLKLGTGFATASGNGYFAQSRAGRNSRAEEKYTLFMVPLTAFLSYRFEFSKKQWLVPYLVGGVAAYGLGEFRNDNADPSFAYSGAGGGGGGLLLAISRLDMANAFTLSEEYGIADMWLAIEALAMQGFSQEVDFTHQQVSLGIQVDF